MKKETKLSKGITGIAGEYLVAGELSMRGYMASITLRNNDGIDIHVSKQFGSKNKIFAIQVKTNQSGKRSWPITKKAEMTKAENLFYVFVSFKDLQVRPEYFIVPSSIVAKSIRNSHTKWLKTPARNGESHKDNNLRKFTDNECQYLDRWDLLK